MIPSGRAMVAKFQEVWVINVYAPSGTAMKQERERFYNSEVPYILTGAPCHVFAGRGFEMHSGDFGIYRQL